MVVVARNGKECTRRELVANGFAWRPLPRAFNLTRFRIQPTKKKHTDRVFLSSASEPLDPACEPLDQTCHCNQPGRSTRIACFFQALVIRWIRLVSRWIKLVVAGSPPPIRKKHTDRVFLSSACEPFDQACEPLDQASCLKPYQPGPLSLWSRLVLQTGT